MADPELRPIKMFIFINLKLMAEPKSSAFLSAYLKIAALFIITPHETFYHNKMFVSSVVLYLFSEK